jgi:hypothetical protein
MLFGCVESPLIRKINCILRKRLSWTSSIFYVISFVWQIKHEEISKGLYGIAYFLSIGVHEMLDVTL